MSRITMTRPDDWHLHLRDGDHMRAILPHAAQRFARAIVMPNLKPPVTTTQMALAYRERILTALPEGMVFEPLMTLYLTDNTTGDEIRRARASGMVHAVKYYPAGATTNSESGVTGLEKCDDALSAMAECGMPLLVHGEVTFPDVDIFDREKVFIDRVLIPLLQKYPKLRLVMEHITTREAARFVLASPPRVAATITAQHLLLNRNAMFAGGIRPSGPDRGGDQWQPEVFSGYRQCAACAGYQGGCLRLCRRLYSACRDRALCRTVRSLWCDRTARGFCQYFRAGVLWSAAQCGKNNPDQGNLGRTRGDSLSPRHAGAFS